MLTLRKYDEDHKMSFMLATYIENDNLYVGLTRHEGKYHEPWSDLTVNLRIKLPPNRAFIDTNNNGNEIIAWLEKNGLGYCTGNLMPSGWCVYPEFKFNMDKLIEHTTEDYRETEM